MAAPDNANELLPISWQVIIAAFTFIFTLGGAAWKFLKSLNAPEPVQEKEHVVLERAELADMNPIREFIREFRPALEKISRIDGMTSEMKKQVGDLCDKMERMERAAIVAKEVREELARRQDELEREHRRRHRDD